MPGITSQKVPLAGTASGDNNGSPWASAVSWTMESGCADWVASDWTDNVCAKVLAAQKKQPATMIALVNVTANFQKEPFPSLIAFISFIGLNINFDE
jgi:hypothetical protein